MKSLGSVAALWVLLAWTAAAHAKAPVEGCIDIQGRNVVWVENPSLESLTKADHATDGWPIAWYNPKKLPSLHPQTRSFFYQHVCGHHVLGHMSREHRTFMMEEQADCWALNTLYYSGKLKDREVNAVQREIQDFKEADWAAVGPRRPINLRACLK